MTEPNEQNESDLLAVSSDDEEKLIYDSMLTFHQALKEVVYSAALQRSKDRQSQEQFDQPLAGLFQGFKNLGDPIEFGNDRFLNPLMQDYAKRLVSFRRAAEKDPSTDLSQTISVNTATRDLVAAYETLRESIPDVIPDIEESFLPLDKKINIPLNASVEDINRIREDLKRFSSGRNTGKWLYQIGNIHANRDLARSELNKARQTNDEKLIQQKTFELQKAQTAFDQHFQLSQLDSLSPGQIVQLAVHQNALIDQESKDRQEALEAFDQAKKSLSADEDFQALKELDKPVLKGEFSYKINKIVSKKLSDQYETTWKGLLEQYELEARESNPSGFSFDDGRPRPLRQQTEVLAQYANPRLSALGYPEIVVPEKPNELEGFPGIISGFAKGFVRFFAETVEGSHRAGAHLFASPEEAEKADKFWSDMHMAAESHPEINTIFSSSEFESEGIGKVSADLGSATASMVQFLTTGRMFGKVPTLVLAGVQEGIPVYNDVYQYIRDTGGSHEEAKWGALLPSVVVGTVNGMLENLSYNAIFDKLPKGPMSRIIHRAFAEGSEEVLQGLFSELNTNLAKGQQPLKWSDVKQSLYEGGIGAILGAATAGIKVSLTEEQLGKIKEFLDATQQQELSTEAIQQKLEDFLRTLPETQLSKREAKKLSEYFVVLDKLQRLPSETIQQFQQPETAETIKEFFGEQKTKEPKTFGSNWLTSTAEEQSKASANNEPKPLLSGDQKTEAIEQAKKLKNGMVILDADGKIWKVKKPQNKPGLLIQQNGDERLDLEGSIDNDAVASALQARELTTWEKQQVKENQPVGNLEDLAGSAMARNLRWLLLDASKGKYKQLAQLRKKYNLTKDSYDLLKLSHGLILKNNLPGSGTGMLRSDAEELIKKLKSPQAEEVFKTINKLTLSSAISTGLEVQSQRRGFYKSLILEEQEINDVVSAALEGYQPDSTPSSIKQNLESRLAASNQTTVPIKDVDSTEDFVERDLSTIDLDSSDTVVMSRDEVEALKARVREETGQPKTFSELLKKYSNDPLFKDHIRLDRSLEWIDLDFATALLSRIQELLSKHPWARSALKEITSGSTEEILKGVQSPNSISPFAWADTKNKRLVLNSSVLSSDELFNSFGAVVNAKTKKGKKVFAVPFPVKPVEYLAAHETAHFLVSAKLSSGERVLSEQLQQEFDQNRGSILDLLSVYAANNPIELAAEAFAETETSPKPRELAVKIRGILDSFFVEQNRGGRPAELKSLMLSPEQQLIAEDEDLISFSRMVSRGKSLRRFVPTSDERRTAADEGRVRGVLLWYNRGKPGGIEGLKKLIRTQVIESAKKALPSDESSSDRSQRIWVPRLRQTIDSFRSEGINPTDEEIIERSGLTEEQYRLAVIAERSRFERFDPSKGFEPFESTDFAEGFMDLPSSKLKQNLKNLHKTFRLALWRFWSKLGVDTRHVAEIRHGVEPVATLFKKANVAEAARSAFRSLRSSSMLDKSFGDIEDQIRKLPRQKREFIYDLRGKKPVTPKGQERYQKALDGLTEQEKVLSKALNEMAEVVQEARKTIDPKAKTFPDYWPGMYKNAQAVPGTIKEIAARAGVTNYHKYVVSGADALANGLVPRTLNIVSMLEHQFAQLAEFASRKEIAIHGLKNNLAVWRTELAKGKSTYGRVATEEELRGKKGLFSQDKNRWVPVGTGKSTIPQFGDIIWEPSAARFVKNLLATNPLEQYPTGRFFTTLARLGAWKSFYPAGLFHIKNVTEGILATVNLKSTILQRTKPEVVKLFKHNKQQFIKDFVSSPKGQVLIRNGLTLGTRSSWEGDLQSSIESFLSSLDDRTSAVVSSTSRVLSAPMTKLVDYQFKVLIPSLKILSVLQQEAELLSYKQRQGQSLDISDAEYQSMIRETQNITGMMNEQLFGRGKFATGFLRLLKSFPSFSEGNIRTVLKALFQWKKGSTNLPFGVSVNRRVIIQHTALRLLTSLLGTLLLGGKLPDPPNNVEDLVDWLHIRTGFKDKNGKDLWLKEQSSVQDYWEFFWLPLIYASQGDFNSVGEQYSRKFLKRLGGMTNPVAKSARDLWVATDGQIITDWKGEEIYSLNDPWYSWLGKLLTNTLGEILPVSWKPDEGIVFGSITLSGYKRTLDRTGDWTDWRNQLLAFMTSLLGLSVDRSEREKQEFKLVDSIRDLYDDRQKAISKLRTIPSGRDTIDQWNRKVDDLLSSKWMTDEVRNHLSTRPLKISYDEYMTNKILPMASENFRKRTKTEQESIFIYLKGQQTTLGQCLEWLRSTTKNRRRDRFTAVIVPQRTEGWLLDARNVFRRNYALYENWLKEQK